MTQRRFRDCDRPFRTRYLPGADKPIDEFYALCLERATRCRRYLHQPDAAAIERAVVPLVAFLAGGGKIQFLIGQPAAEPPVRLAASAMVPLTLAIRPVAPSDELAELLRRDPLVTLTALANSGALEVRSVAPELCAGLGSLPASFGVFSDGADEHVCFTTAIPADTGESLARETGLDVIWSWGDPAKTAEQMVIRFDALWESAEGAMLVPPRPPGDLRYSEETQIMEAAETTRVREEAGPPPVGPAARPGTIPRGVELRDYQKDAIRQWLTGGGRGILAMATGAGKTLTALCLASKVLEHNQPLAIIVVCPYVNLAIQWGYEMSRFGFTPIPCYQGREKWEHLVSEAYQRLRAGLSGCVAMAVSNATFLSPSFQQVLQLKAVTHLLIADEVHHLGAAHLRTALPEAIPLRLGLSATPERHGDLDGTESLFNYFGGVVYEFGLARGIAEGVLVPYHYHPVLVDLTLDEAVAYRELSGRIARAFARDADETQQDRLKMLLLKRARLLASAANKLPALGETLRRHDGPVEKAIFYCGDGTAENAATAETDRQITAVTRLLGETHQLKVRRFTCEENAADREEILQALRTGGLDALVAIRCLDEGIDVPDVRLGFLLASSSNPRQFIQRRGRLLRRAPGKTHAVIYDFIVRPPDLGGEMDSDAFNAERRIFGRELERVLEFCRSAENGPAALRRLQDLRLAYNLLAS